MCTQNCMNIHASVTNWVQHLAETSKISKYHTTSQFPCAALMKSLLWICFKKEYVSRYQAPA